jgi:hypothetical protein
MTRTPSPTTVALRNQLLAILHDAEQPPTTLQVGGRVTGFAAAVYPQLCVLHRPGYITRVHYPNPDSIAQATAQKRLSQHLTQADSRCAYWHYLDADADHALNALLDAVQDA